MSSVRDNTAAGASNIPLPPTSADPSASQGLSDISPIPSEAAADNRHARAEEDFQKRQTAFQSDFAKKVADPPGFGGNEDAYSKQLKQGMAASNLTVPTKQQVQITQANVGQTKEFKAAVDGVKSTIDNNGVVPPGVSMGQLLTSALGASTVLNKAAAPGSKATVGDSSTGNSSAAPTAASLASLDAQMPAANGSAAITADESATPVASPDGNTAAAEDPTGAAPSTPTTPMASTGSGLPVTTNTSALVFLVILQAQAENTKEKGDVLRKIQMYNGMLDALNDYSNNKLIPAQKEIQDLQNAGKGKKDFNASNVQVEVDGAYSSLDTDNAMQDADTGKVVLMGASAGRQLVDSTSLGNLIQQADQWRTSIQNNQTQQSNRFQSKDNQMSSAWNILNAILKNTHDGVSSTVRNI